MKKKIYNKKLKCIKIYYIFGYNLGKVCILYIVSGEFNFHHSVTWSEIIVRKALKIHVLR